MPREGIEPSTTWSFNPELYRLSYLGLGTAFRAVYQDPQLERNREDSNLQTLTGHGLAGRCITILPRFRNGGSLPVRDRAYFEDASVLQDHRLEPCIWGDRRDSHPILRGHNPPC